MQDLAGCASALRSQRESIISQTIDTLSDHVLSNLHEPERAIDRLVGYLLDALASGNLSAVTDWARSEGREQAERYLTEMVSSATFAVCSGAEGVYLDRRPLLEFCDRLKTEVADVVAELSALADEEETGSEAFTAVLAALHARDVATCSHSRATGSWARRLATAMRLSTSEIEHIECAALLHDVGKIATPDYVLLKPGPLTEEEWVVMRKHAEAGEALLNGIPSLAQYSRIVRAHHERFDGTGYPDGLRGNEILFEARVVAVVDSFHAMISKRPYRDALTPRAALNILRAGAGTQWDTQVTGAMIALLENKPAAVPRIAAFGA